MSYIFFFLAISSLALLVIATFTLICAASYILGLRFADWFDDKLDDLSYWMKKQRRSK